MRCHTTRSATEIGNRPDTGGFHEFGERSKQGTVQRLRREFRSQQLGIVDGDRVIGAPSRMQVGRLGHAHEP